jgi:hypothetical protein
LWERGFTNSENIAKSLEDYTIKGRKDQYGIINVRFSLTHLLSTCTDFEEEETILQTMGCQMGILLQHPLGQQKRQGKFKGLRMESLSREILTTALVRKLSKCARSYMQGYHVLNQINQGLIETSDKKWQTNGTQLGTVRTM